MPQGTPAVPFVPLAGLIKATYHHVQGLGYHPMYLRSWQHNATLMESLRSL
jgi:hypothetical protein